MLNHGSLERALTALGEVLESRGLSYELVAAGGSGLLLLGLLTRPTRDIDIVAYVASGEYHKAKPLPVPLLEAARDVGEALGLGADWMNPGLTDLLDFGLPEGFRARVDIRSFGALTLHLASRLDQIYLKLYAATDQGASSKHFQDLVRLSPVRDELFAAARWSRTHDPSPGYRVEVVALLAALGINDADAHV